MRNRIKYSLVLLLLGALFSRPMMGICQLNPEEEQDTGKGFNADYIVLFADRFDKSRLKIFASVVYDDMQFLKTDDEFKAEYRITFTVLDDDGEYISSERVDRMVVVQDYYITNSREEYDWVEMEFDLAAGEYQVILEFMDKDSRETKRKEKTITIPNLEENSLILTGPILLDSIVMNQAGELELQPGISGDIFDGKKGVWVYFEALSREYPVDLQVSYHLIDSKGKERISGDYSRHIEKPVLRDKFQLDIDEFTFDDYQLVLVVSFGDNVVRRSKKFRIHWPELPPTIRDLDKAIEQLTYIASEREISRLEEDYLGRKLEMFLKFWAQWGKDEAESFKLMEEYYRRIWEAEQSFNEGGWRSDRGHVYIIHGAPSEIDRHPYDMYSKAYEIWYYYQDNKRFVFVDEGGFGNFRLQSPLWQN